MWGDVGRQAEIEDVEVSELSLKSDGMKRMLNALANSGVGEGGGGWRE